MKLVQEQNYKQRENRENRADVVPAWIAAGALVFNGIMPACRDPEYLKEVCEWAARIEKLQP